jgi:PEP-CTERM motif
VFSIRINEVIMKKRCSVVKMNSGVKSMLSALVISASMATAAKADTFLTYNVDASYNNGGGTITGTFTVDATVAATAPGGTQDLTAINLVQTGSGGINSFNFTNTSVASDYLYESPSFYNLTINDGGNDLNLGFDLNGGALATTGFGESTVETEFSGAPIFVVSGTITEGPGIAPAVPEPSTWAMMILGYAGIGFMAYRRKSKPLMAT